MSRYDSDPDALAWARERVQHYIDRCETWAAAGGPHAEESEKFAALMHMWFIGSGDGCVLTAFDARRPELAEPEGSIA